MPPKSSEQPPSDADLLLAGWRKDVNGNWLQSTTNLPAPLPQATGNSTTSTISTTIDINDNNSDIGNIDDATQNEKLAETIRRNAKLDRASESVNRIVSDIQKTVDTELSKNYSIHRKQLRNFSCFVRKPYAVVCVLLDAVEDAFHSKHHTKSAGARKRVLLTLFIEPALNATLTRLDADVWTTATGFRSALLQILDPKLPCDIAVPPKHSPSVSYEQFWINARRLAADFEVVKPWIAATYINAIIFRWHAQFEKLFVPPTHFEDDMFSMITTARMDAIVAQPWAQRTPAAAIPQTNNKANTSNKYTSEQFIIGAATSGAHNSAVTTLDNITIQHAAQRCVVDVAIDTQAAVTAVSLAVVDKLGAMIGGEPETLGGASSANGTFDSIGTTSFVADVAGTQLSVTDARVIDGLRFDVLLGAPDLLHNDMSLSVSEGQWRVAFGDASTTHLLPQPHNEAHVLAPTVKLLCALTAPSVAHTEHELSYSVGALQHEGELDIVLSDDTVIAMSNIPVIDNGLVLSEGAVSAAVDAALLALQGDVFPLAPVAIARDSTDVGEGVSLKENKNKFTFDSPVSEILSNVGSQTAIACSTAAYRRLRAGLRDELQRMDAAMLLASKNAPSPNVLKAIVGVTHRVVLRTGADLRKVHATPRRFAPAQRRALADQIDAWVQMGIVSYRHEPSYVSNAPVVVAKRDANGKQTGWRCCIDFRMLNEQTERDRLPMPFIYDVLDVAANGPLRSVIDMSSYFQQFNLDEESRALTTTNVGSGRQIQFHRLPFGLSNASATAQRATNRIFGNDAHCAGYIDDLVQSHSTRDVDTLLADIKRLVDRSINNNVTWNASKTYLCHTEMALLGH